MTETEAVSRITTLLSSSASRLKERWSPVWRVLTFSLADSLILQQKNITVAIDKGSISAAYVSRALSKTVVRGGKRYTFKEGSYPQPNDLVSSLALSVNELDAAGTDITLSIPKAWTIIRTVDLPSTVKENLPDVISYEMDRLTPFTPEEVFYDYRILQDEGDKVSLIIIAVRTDIIRPYLEALDESGFNVSRITVNLAGMGALCQYIFQEADSVFIEIDRNGSEAALFIDGLMTAAFSDEFSPHSDRESGLNADEERGLEAISKKTRTLIENAGEKGRSPKVVLHLKERIPDLSRLLEEQIGVPVKVLGEAGSGLEFEAIYSGISASDNEISYAALGNALQSLQTDTSPPDLLKRGIHEEKKPPVGLTVFLLLAIALMWIIYSVAPIGMEERRLEEISLQIELKQEDVKKVQKMKKAADELSAEIAAITGFNKALPMRLEIIKELTSVIPGTSWLTKVRIVNGSVEIRGYADSATALLPKLEASEYFSKVEFTSPTIRDIRMNSDRFSIRMQITGTETKI